MALASVKNLLVGAAVAALFAGEELAQKEQGIERDAHAPGHRAAPLTDLRVSGIRTGGEQKTNEKRGHGDSSCHFGILLLSHIWKEQSRKRRWGPFLLRD